MSRLTEDLLTLARVESGETRFDMEPVLPNELLHDAEESFARLHGLHGIDLQIEELQRKPSTHDPVVSRRRR